MRAVTSLLSQAHLFRLISPTLPVGAYSYSQGLEWAIEEGTVRDEAGAAAWIGDALRFVVAHFEAPIALRLFRAWLANDADRVRHWNGLFLAAREGAELRAETVQMGYSLTRLITELGGELDADQARRRVLLNALDPCSFPAALAYAAAEAGIGERDFLLGLFWAWSENQVMAALKAVPLGQTAGQRMLCTLIASLPALVEECSALPDEDISNFAPGFAIASCRHETQYSRLFRS
jgi:urease accessory protein